MPISALFILFDLVIHNPTHPQTNNNLALLDVASGHFGRIEYATSGTLPGSLVSEFAHIARDFVRDSQREKPSQNAQIITNNVQNNSLDIVSNPPIQTSKEVLDTSNVSLEPQMSCDYQSQLQCQLNPAAPNTITHQTKPPGVQHQQSSNTYLRHNSNPSVGTSQPSDSTLPRADAGAEQIFFPLADDPTYAVQRDDGDLQQLLGIDVMDLFDFTAPFNWGC